MKNLGLISPFLLVCTLCSCHVSFSDTTTESPESVFDACWQEVDRNYAFFEENHLDWDSVYRSNRQKINDQTTPSELVGVLGQMLDNMHDAHTNLYTNLGMVGNDTYFNNFAENSIELPNPMVQYFGTYVDTLRVFRYGRILNRKIGYLKIVQFNDNQQYFREIIQILENMQSTESLIIDLRDNRGGFVANAHFLAQYFADSSRVAYRYRSRNGTGHKDFSRWQTYTTTPNNDLGYRTKPIVLLTNRNTYSATELFALCLKVRPHTIQIGDYTGGGSGLPLSRDLPNGWIVRISNTQTLTNQDKSYQQTGIAPDIQTSISRIQALRGYDTILLRAIDWLEQN